MLGKRCGIKIGAGPILIAEQSRCTLTCLAVTRFALARSSDPVPMHVPPPSSKIAFVQLRGRGRGGIITLSGLAPLPALLPHQFVVNPTKCLPTTEVDDPRLLLIYKDI